jgi:hypothetical protein
MMQIATRIVRFLAVALLLTVASRAMAADPVYPRGVRVGLVPLVGLVPAKTFSGFETEDHSVRVLITELPAATYNEVEKALKTNPAEIKGVKPESIDTAAGKAFYTAESGKVGNSAVRRYSMILPGGSFSGFVAVQVPENATKIYSDEAVRQMFSSAAIRKDVPVDEQLSVLPFKVTALSNFKSVRTLAPGVAVMLADSSEETGVEKTSFMVLGVIGSVPEDADDRARFARQAAATIPGLREAHITVAEPIRIDGVPGFETRIDALSGKDKTPVTVVQWLRFGAGNTALRVIGSAPRDQWESAFPRFRAVRDGVKPK